MAVVWSENFSGTIGTDVENYGFSALTNAGRATISSGNSLQIKGGKINNFASTEAITVGGQWTNFSFPGSGGSTGGSTGKSSIVMPDGSTNGYRYTYAGWGTGTSAWSGIKQNINLARGVPWTLSVWAATESGTTTIRPYIYDDGQTLTLSSNDIVITTTPTRISATITVPSTGTTVGGTVGFGQGTTNNGATVVFWGAQLESGSVASPYRKMDNTSAVSVFQFWTKDVGVVNQSLECDILTSGGSDQSDLCILPLALRVQDTSHYIGIAYYKSNLIITNPNYTTLYTVGLPQGTTPPFRLRAEAVDNKIFLFIGPAGIRFPTQRLGSTSGYNINATDWSTSTKVGFGFHYYNATANVVVSDNYEANPSASYINPIKGRSETDGSDFTSVLPAADSHNDPAWYEPFQSNQGAVENRGFKRWSSTGYAIDNYNHNNALGYQVVPNRITESNDLMHSSWQLIGGATRLGYVSDPVFETGSPGTRIHFNTGTLSGIRNVPVDSVPGSGNGGTVYNTFSCYVAAVSGTTSVRLGAIARNVNYSTQYSSDFTVTTTPQRLSFTAVQKSILGAMGWYGAIVSNSALNSADVVAWGYQIEYGNTLTAFRSFGSSNINPGIWTKPVQSPRQYVECDIFPPYDYPATAMRPILAAVRVMAPKDFVGVYMGSNGNDLRLYVPGRIDRSIGTLSSPTRFRIEANNNEIQVFTGPAGVRDAHNLFYQTTLAEDIYTGFLTSTDTGWGIDPISSEIRYPKIADTYESGANIGPFRHYMTPTKGRSDTRADTVQRVDLAWVENFDAPVGTALVDLGFQWKSTEFQGDPRKAVVGSNHRLTLLSSVKSSAIWYKPTSSLNHFVEADITAYPLVEYEYPLIIRAYSSEHFIGIWFEQDNLVLGYRYASTNVVLTRVPKNTLTLPFRLRLEAKGHYIYAFRSTTSSGGVANQSIGNSAGYRIDDAAPLLLMSDNAGMGRVNDIQADNIADNYFAGISYIASSNIPSSSIYKGTSPTRARTGVADDIARPYVFKATSGTRVPDPEQITIEFNQDVTPISARTETLARVPDIQPEAVSYTTADRAVVTVDIVIVNRARSESSAEFYHEPATVPSGQIGRSETLGDSVTTQIHTTIFEDKDTTVPGEIHNPSRSKRAHSTTRANRAPVNGLSVVDGTTDPNGGFTNNRSETKAGIPGLRPERFVHGVTARSDTLGRATFAAIAFYLDPDGARSPTRADGPNAAEDEYRPWLFT